MVDFDRLAEDEPDVDPTDPFALYGSLDRQHTHVELRPGQIEALTRWKDRRGVRDIVLKLPTGAGKTTAGLVMLLSFMREHGLPALYLCPNNHLAEQVVQEGTRCGIKCVIFGQGDRHVPAEVLAGEAVLVTSVQKLVNAKTVFARSDVAFEPFAILVDDAHAAIEIVRDQFTVQANANSALYRRLYGLFETELREQSPGMAASLKAGDPTATVEVPYWRWIDQLDDVAKAIADASEEKNSDVKFTWGLIRDYLPGLRCVFSGAGVEITPEVLPVAAIHAYHTAKHRIFMSATLSDEAALVRELDCAPEAAANPIELASGGGLGERMIIVPHLMSSGAKGLTWEGLAEICKKVSASAAVVVIAPSDAAAKRWEAVGARVVKGDIGDAVDGLRDGRERFVAFSNRYDGIDLPDEACRLLVLDGAPITYSLLDSIDGGRGGPGNLRQRGIMHRIEQGLG